ncbi:MAG: hypothetical protein NHB15_14890 [Methanosarcina barkeri]|nr:hypothetical protein [Methanosarcina sp. ERenArc_MAG2]
MQRFGKSWKIASYLSEDLARKFEEERKKTRLSESGFVAVILEVVLLPDPVGQDGV